ncbi:MAG TPA: hypothetical protein VFY52_03430 [Thermoleophilaceae bacterium]|nr:hypothetical protein [Thermoleophilaceae bacterium]
MGSVIRLVAIVLSGFVVVGFAFFAADELDRGSKTQQQALAHELEGSTPEVIPVAPAPAGEAAREAAHGDLREIVDDVNDVLLGPFSNLADSSDVWVARGVPTILALLLYGFGLGFLANMLPKHRSHGADWRGADA